MASRLGALRAAGRIAARDARRAKGRTALVATMIGLPLLVGTAGGTLLNSLDPTPEQVAASRLGDVAQAEITGWFDEGVIQGPLGHYGGWSSSGSSDAEQPSLEEHEAAVAAVLPAGSELVRASLGGGMTTSEERSRPSSPRSSSFPRTVSPSSCRRRWPPAPYRVRPVRSSSTMAPPRPSPWVSAAR